MCKEKIQNIYIYLKGRTIGWVGHEARMERNAGIIRRKTRRGHKEYVE
jgi:citrate synthase